MQQIEYTGIRNRNSLKLVIVFDLITKEELAQFVGILKSLPLGGKGHMVPLWSSTFLRQ